MNSINIFCFTIFLLAHETSQNIDSCEIDSIVSNINVKRVAKKLLIFFEISKCLFNFDEALKGLKIKNLNSSILKNNFKSVLNVTKTSGFNNDRKSIIEIELNQIFDINNLTIKEIDETVEREIKYSKKLWSRSKNSEPIDLASKFVKEFVNNISYIRIAPQDSFKFDYVTKAGNKRKRKKRIRLREPGKANSKRTSYFLDVRATSIKSYPFLVSVHENGKFVCPGSIIQSELVITAASCLKSVYLRNVKTPMIHLRVASDSVKSGGYVVAVTEAVFHPSYEHKTLQNNIVLLHVAEGSLLKYAWIQRIRYEQGPNVHTQLGSNIKTVVVLGWGNQEHGEQVEKKEILALPNMFTFNNGATLCVSDLRICNLNSCNGIYGRNFNRHQSICIQSSNNATRLCNYEVGSPVIHGGSLLGIISLGPERRGFSQIPVVVTRIASYISWIHEVSQKIIPMLVSIEGNATYVKARRRGSSRPRFNLRDKNKSILRRAKKSKTILNDSLKIKNLSVYKDYFQNMLTLMKALPQTAINDFVESKYNGLVNIFKDTFSSFRSSDNQTFVSKMTNLRTTSEVEKTSPTPLGEIELEWKVLLDENEEMIVETTSVIETSSMETTMMSGATIHPVETIKHDYHDSIDHLIQDKTHFNNQNTRFEFATQTITTKEKEQQKHVELSSDELTKMLASVFKNKLHRKISRSHKKRRVRKKKRKQRKVKHSRKKTKH